MCVNSGEADLPDRLRWSGLGQITGRSRQPVHSGVEGDETCLRASAGVRARGTGHCLGPRCPSCWHLAPPPFLAWDGVGGLVGRSVASCPPSASGLWGKASSPAPHPGPAWGAGEARASSFHTPHSPGGAQPFPAPGSGSQATVPLQV